jgi:hypothetical protein
MRVRIRATSVQRHQSSAAPLRGNLGRIRKVSDLHLHVPWRVGNFDPDDHGTLNQRATRYGQEQVRKMPKPRPVSSVTMLQPDGTWKAIR